VSPIAFRLAYWRPLGSFRFARHAARVSIGGVNCFGTKSKVTQAVDAVEMRMDCDLKVLLIFLVLESRNAKHSR